MQTHAIRGLRNRVPSVRAIHNRVRLYSAQGPESVGSSSNGGFMTVSRKYFKAVLFFIYSNSPLTTHYVFCNLSFDKILALDSQSDTQVDSTVGYVTLSVASSYGIYMCACLAFLSHQRKSAEFTDKHGSQPEDRNISFVHVAKRWT
jgi:hypothetical protein